MEVLDFVRMHLMGWPPLAQAAVALALIVSQQQADYTRNSHSPEKWAEHQGILTTFLPLLLGTSVGLLFGYSAVSAVVIGSLLASHSWDCLPSLDLI